MKGQPKEKQHALPVFSVDTLEQARVLQLLACSMVNVGDEGDFIYIIPNFGGELEDIPAAQERLQAFYNRMKK